MDRGLRESDHGLDDYLRPGLNVVFVGFNPGLISAERGHYYANPRNGFWRLLSHSGLVTRSLTCEDDRRIRDFGIGLTDLVKRPTKSSIELQPREIDEGRIRLRKDLEKCAARVVAFNGMGVYKLFRQRRQAAPGPQTELLGKSRVFVLPSTSPVNARWRQELPKWFSELKTFVDMET